MSRLTGTDAYGLMEAYQAVYAPQELTEEQVWEEVETWVNSLLEEGYDLSDYTWEEMYESYLNEFSGNLIGDLKANAGNIARGVSGAYQGAMRTASNVNQAISDRMQRNIKPKPAMPGLPPSAAQPGGPNSNRVGTYTSRFAGARDAAFARAQNIKGSPVVGTGSSPAAPAPRQQPAPAARPSAAPARTSTPPGGTTKPTAPATTTPTPAPSAPRPKDTSITDMIGRSQVRQGAAVNTGNTSSDTRAIAGRSSVGATPKPATSTATARPTPRQARLNMEMEYDTFDTVLEYLVSEGYADTEEAALVIMANMSEEWKESIVEEDEKLLAARKKSIRRLNAAKNIEDRQAEGDYENSIDHSNPSKGKSGYMEVPTDYRARRRRASGR